MSASRSAPAGVYFVNPLVDALMIGAGSMLLLAAFLVLGVQGGRAEFMKINWILVSLLNWPHFAATIYRLYHSRENAAQYPMTAAVVPLLMAAASAGALASPAVIAPLLIKVFLIWSPYHYSGQTVGLSVVYARRSGYELSRLSRFALGAFVFATFIYSTARAETSLQAATYFGVTYPRFGLPHWVPMVLGWWMWACGAGLAASLAWRAWQERRLPHGMILLPAATQFVWFIVGPRNAAFYQLVPAFHGLQYLLIAWATQLREKQVELGILGSRRYAVVETLRWAGTNVAVGVGLFWALPRLVALGGWPLNYAIPVTISAVQIHHFFVDGVIWRLKSRKVGSTVLVRLGQLTGTAAA